MTSTPTACFFMPPVKARATSRATSASSIDRRTSRNAPSTSASLSAPRRVRRSRTPPSFSDRLSNIASPETAHLATACKHFYARGRIALSGGCLRPLMDRAAKLNCHVSIESGRNLGSGCGQVKASQGKSKQVKTSQNKSKQVKEREFGHGLRCELITDADNRPKRLFAGRDRDSAGAQSLHWPWLRGWPFFADGDHLPKLRPRGLCVEFGLAVRIGDGVV